MVEILSGIRIKIQNLILIIILSLIIINSYYSIQIEIEECTAGVFGPESNTLNLPIIWKNRDLSGRSKQVQVLIIGHGKYDFIGITTKYSSGIAFGINAAGLAAGNTYIEVKGEGGPIGNLKLNRLILENTKTIDEAYNYIKSLSGKAYGSSIVIGDVDKVGVIDICKDIALNLNTTIKGWIIRTNHWRNILPQNFSKYEAGLPGSSSKARYQSATEYVRKIISNRKLKLIDIFMLSKSHINKISNLSICRHGSSISTVSAGIIVIFSIKPELSVMWTSLGQPCTSIFTPIIVAISKLNISSIEYWSNGNVWRNNELIRNQIYGSNKLYEKDKETTDKIFNLISNVEESFINYIELLWKIAIGIENKNPTDITNNLISKIDEIRISITNQLIKKNYIELALAINIALKYSYIILKYDLKAISHTTQKKIFIDAAKIFKNQMIKIDNDLNNIENGKLLEEPVKQTVMSNQLIIISSIIVVAVASLSFFIIYKRRK